MCTKTEINKNRIKTICANLGFEKFRPTDEVLQKIGITPHRFNKIIENEVEMTANEIIHISEWLGVSMNEIFEEKVSEVQQA